MMWQECCIYLSIKLYILSRCRYVERVIRLGNEEGAEQSLTLKCLDAASSESYSIKLASCWSLDFFSFLVQYRIDQSSPYKGCLDVPEWLSGPTGKLIRHNSQTCLLGDSSIRSEDQTSVTILYYASVIIKHMVAICYNTILQTCKALTDRSGAA